jgi:hypothetical protein
MEHNSRQGRLRGHPGKEFEMENKFISFLLVVGLIASLAACGPAETVEPATTVPASPQIPATETTIPKPSPVPETETPRPVASEAPIDFDCDTAREIAVWDCRALVALYESTHGASWKEHPGWFEGGIPCYWYGVTCEDGHVTELVLFDNGLSGTLPPELEDLTHLRVIRMFNNQLRGSLSPRLGRISSLMELDLARNHFSGEIPAELGHLMNLTWLNLSGNDLSGAIPAELGNLQQLKQLNLASNRLNGSIPGKLGELKDLGGLDLSHNELSGTIPAELVNLANTYWLDLSYNQLSGAVPDEWATESIDEVPAAGSGSAPRLWGNRLEGTVHASNDSSTEVLFEGIRFSYPTSVAESVWPQIVAGVPPKLGETWAGIDPSHFSLSFASPSGPAAMQRYWGTWLQLPPQIKVYPVASMGSSEIIMVRVQTLRELLETKPASPAGEIPVLPLINAAQVFRSQVRYLDFQNGSGVRFITQYRQDPAPVTDDEIFYTFQGLTEDGAYYVVASFPLSTDVLPDTLDFESQAFREFERRNYEEYLKEQVDMLDALPPGQFEPDLAMLDQIVGSLEVQSK